MVVWCKYCSLPVASYSQLKCQVCDGFVHFNCLKKEKPSRLEGDILFDFICSSCGDEEGEKVTRVKMTWLQAIHIALYNLSIRESGRQGFFRWKDDICTFLSQNWSVLFLDKPMTNNWRSTVAGTLSVYCAKLFKSGQAIFNETGWWALEEVKPPPKSYGNDIKNRQQNSKSKDMKRKFDSFDQEAILSLGRGKRNKCDESSVEKGVCFDGKGSLDEELNFDDESLGSVQMQEELNGDDFNVNQEDFEGIVPTGDPFSLLKVEDLGKELSQGLLDSAKEPPLIGDLQSVLVKTETTSVDNNSKDSQSFSQEQAKAKTQRSVAMNQMLSQGKLTPMNLMQEMEFLSKLISCSNAISEDPAANRLRRKLKLRKLKAEMGLPLFDVDTRVRKLIKRSAPEGVEVAFTDVFGRELASAAREEESREHPVKASSLHHPALQGVNVLDKFRTGLQPNARGVPSNRKYRTFLSRLVGCKDEMKTRTIVSPYTQRVLKPFIRRDFEAKPLKLRLTEELIAYTHRYDQHWISPCPYPIDYCYVQPHHIPAVNAMCEDFFWRGINLSECLQYPDFSCVVLYKKLVIGFAFMVPDVKYNEAYISFILVHPDWRRAGIGTFMIYHLIQTCMGKDVTLHVSASNPSIMLYQKFGFKAEEFILDFYDKYLPEDSNESKHAFFLRLQR